MPATLLQPDHAMHTTTIPTEPDRLEALRQSIEAARLELELAMLRAQTRALETLERLMNDPEPTGNGKSDKARATERHRQRLAANQVLIHCRTAQRENRLSQATRAPASSLIRESDRMTRRPEPSDHPRAPFGGAMVGAEGAGHADNGTPNAPSHGLRPTMPRPRSRYKVRKPKHPRQCRRRKRKS
jgi:hypothetical protein